MLQQLIMSRPHLATKLLNKKGKTSALNAFKTAAGIPAYKSFLEKNKIDVNSIKSIDDFNKLPVTDKENYIKAYPIEERIRYQMWKNYTIERSSGFSGEPNYWVRFTGQDDTTEKRIVTLVDLLFNIKTKKTLMINTFAMGTWIAGVKSARWFLNAANNPNLDMTVVNVGINLEESVDIFKRFYKFYDQTIFIGYNPFLKQVIESIKNQNVPLDNHTIHLLMGGESVSENWRDYIADLLGYKVEEFKGRIISGYGAADMGSDIGVEQPFSIMLRRAFIKNKELREKYFNGEEYVPMMFQYSPAKIYIETNQHQELLFTTNSGVPLVRYNLHDKGGTIPYLEALEIVKREYGEEYVKTVLKPMPLPIVYLFGRTDSTIHLVGVNIFIEHIKQSINIPKISKYLTGRFFSYVEEDSNMNQQFNIVAESIDIQQAQNNLEVIKDSFIDSLSQLNSEYSHLFATNPNISTPVFKFMNKSEFDTYANKNIKISYIKK